MDQRFTENTELARQLADFVKSYPNNKNMRIVTADQKRKETAELMAKRAKERAANPGPQGHPGVHVDKYPLGGYDPRSHRSYSE